MAFRNNFEAAFLLLNNNTEDIPLASVLGTYEGSIDYMWSDIRDTALKYGAQNMYFNSYPEGHSWGLWKQTLPQMLFSGFPRHR